MSARNRFDRRQNKIIWQVVASIMAIGMAGQAAKGQTTNAPATGATPSGTPPSAATPPAEATASSTNVTELPPTVVTAQKLNAARDTIIPDLGATAHSFNQEQIQVIPQGVNAPFNQILLRAPGVVEDSAENGDLHIRGEHANLQYRINDVLLPEGIVGFGLELDPRFIQSMELITGSLPASYGFRTAGVVDIKTKSGLENGGDFSIYGGSFSTFRPSFEVGGTQGKWNFYADGSYDQNALGIENPIPTYNAIHDQTQQYKAFAYGSYIIDDTSRIMLMGSAYYSHFQIPNTTNTPVGVAPDGTTPWNFTGSGLPTTFNSADENENQTEQNYYAVASYQKSAGPFNMQASVFGRISSVDFTPDPVGDLFFNGVASNDKRTLYSGGLQVDASYELGDYHTIRSGVLVINEGVSHHSTTTVFAETNGTPSGMPFPITDNAFLHGIFAGIYLQDEWKLIPKVTVNYGARFDVFYASFDKENQPSPRVNLIYTPTDSTTLHAGYSRYFTPPPVENVSATTVTQFDGTSNFTGSDKDSGVKAERANYFDAGVSQKIGSHFQIGMDGYYKNAVQQLDDGLFGQTLILSAFNYQEGRVYGLEFPLSYNLGGFSSYANMSYSKAQGKTWDSAQFLFGAEGAGTKFNYVQNHWIYLDHDQTLSVSTGAAYDWKHPWGGTRVFADAIWGSGLRQDGGPIAGSQAIFPPSGTAIPNGGTVPAYYSVSLGAEEAIKLSGKHVLKARIDVVNVTDNTYELRSGTGVGVNAAQWGERRAFFGTLSYSF